MKNQPFLVQKYGGATLSDSKKIKAIAKKISKKRLTHQLIIVVSAMGKTTDHLIHLANEVSTRPQRREMDMLLSTGERISMALMSMALNNLYVPAISFTGSQAGVFTNESHANAQIIDVKPIRIQDELEKNKVIILAGFQGVSPITKEITTLGRGGSDTTAIAMAAYFQAQQCEILKDVSSVFSADPRLIKNVKPILHLTYDQLLNMTFWGSQFLHYRCAELAKLAKVKVYVGPAHGKMKTGTWISDVQSIKNKKRKDMFESSRILAISSHENILQIKIPHNDFKKLKDFLEEKQIPFPQIIYTELSKEMTLYLTGPKEIINSLYTEIKKSKSYHVSRSRLSSVTLTCTGITSGELTENVITKLNKQKIPFEKIFFQPMSMTIVLTQIHRNKAIQALHTLIVSF